MMSILKSLMFSFLVDYGFYFHVRFEPVKFVTRSAIREGENSFRIPTMKNKRTGNHN